MNTSENCSLFFNQQTHIATLQWKFPNSSALIHYTLLKSVNLPFITTFEDPPIALRWYSKENPFTVATHSVKPHSIARQLISFMRILETTFHSHIFAFSIEDIVQLNHGTVLFTNPLHISSNSKPILFPITFEENPELEKREPPFQTTKQNGFFAIAQTLNNLAEEEPYYYSHHWKNFINNAIKKNVRERTFII